MEGILKKPPLDWKKCLFLGVELPAVPGSIWPSSPCEHARDLSPIPPLQVLQLIMRGGNKNLGLKTSWSFVLFIVLITPFYLINDSVIVLKVARYQHLIRAALMWGIYNLASIAILSFERKVMRNVFFVVRGTEGKKRKQMALLSTWISPNKMITYWIGFISHLLQEFKVMYRVLPPPIFLHNNNVRWVAKKKHNTRFMSPVRLSL